MRNKKVSWVIAFILVTAFTLFLVFSNNNRPEFFDIFGLVVFIYLFIVGVWMFKQKREIPNWIKFPIITIGVMGFVVDGYIVLKTFILG